MLRGVKSLYRAIGMLSSDAKRRRVQEAWRDGKIDSAEAGRRLGITAAMVDATLCCTAATAAVAAPVGVLVE